MVGLLGKRSQLPEGSRLPIVGTQRPQTNITKLLRRKSDDLLDRVILNVGKLPRGQLLPVLPIQTPFQDIFSNESTRVASLHGQVAKALE